jgi:uncharacterized membrane protein
MRKRLSILTRLRPGRGVTEESPAIHLTDDKPESARALRRGARVRGRKAGRAAAFGHPQAERIHDLPGRQMLEKSVHKRQRYANAWIVSRKQTLRASIGELPGRITTAAGNLKTAKEQLKQSERALGELRDDHSPSLFTYLLVLGLLASAEYPTLASALRVFPFDAGTRKFLGFVLSGVLAVAAHYLAKRINVLRDARAEGRKRPFEVVFVTIFVIAVVGLMAAMSLTRGDAFNEIATITGNAFGNPALLTTLMLAVQVMLFVIALAVGLQHAEGDTRRKLAKTVRRAKREVRRKVGWHEGLLATKARDEEELKNIGETERLWLAEEDELLGELLTRHDHAYEATEHSVWTRILARVITPRLREARA